MTPRDLLEPDLQSLDLERSLLVDLTQRRLSEVRDLGAGETADEALRPDDADLDLAELENDMPAVEDDDPRARKTSATSVAWPE